MPERPRCDTAPPRPPRPIPWHGPNYRERYPSQAALDDRLKAVPPSEARARAESFRALTARSEALLREGAAGLEHPFSTRLLAETVAKELETALLTSAQGRIEAILLAVPYEWDEVTRTATINHYDERHFSNVVWALERDEWPKKRTYVVVHHPDHEEALDRWRAHNGIPVTQWLPVRTKFKYSAWVQDPLVVLASNNACILCEGVLFNRFEDMAVVDEVVAGVPENADVGLSALQSFLAFHGGNILSTLDCVLVGRDHIWPNTGRPGLDDEDSVLARYRALFGKEKEIVPLGLGWNIPRERWWRDVPGIQQPAFHIDLHVTPTGVRGDSGKEIVFYGSPGRAREVLGVLPHEDGLDDAFREVEDQLREHFEVRPLPLLPWYGALGVPDWEDRCYYLSWNNALVESYEEAGVAKRRVLLPSYTEADDLKNYRFDGAIRKDLQAEAKEAWQNLDFEVVELDGMEDLAYGGGAAHCITKVLKRSAS